ncbi:MAG: hypothetical protein KDA85_21955, partial [Planctomycetaceae bacterium]|nr:hypothetical protein [Planctomycetaceae bacterium]
TAVQSQIEVIDRRQPSRRPELPPPTPAGTVKLTMTISEPLEQPRENEWTEYDFEITNEGTATADNVQVNLNIDLGLRHHRITEDDIERELASGSFSLAPNQTRTLPLRVKPMSRGRYFCTAELRHNGAQVELRSLEFTALRAPEVPATDSPE